MFYRNVIHTYALRSANMRPARSRVRRILFSRSHHLQNRIPSLSVTAHGRGARTRMPCICTYAMRLFPKPCCHVRCPCVLPLACRCRSPTAHRLPAFHQPPTRPSQTNFSASNPAPPQNNSLAMSQTTSIGITHVLTSHQSSPATKPSPRPATPSTNRPRRQNTPPCPAHKTPPLQNHPATNQPRCAIIDILQASTNPRLVIR